MKIINIPSVNSEKCNTILKFYEKKYEKLPWDEKAEYIWQLELECSSPTFKGKINTQLGDNYLRKFVDNLKKVEMDRKGQCELSYQEEYGLQGGWSVDIHSIDSLGHFVVDVTINDLNESGMNSLKISYEIEPSLLTDLLEKFNDLLFETNMQEVKKQ